MLTIKFYPDSDVNTLQEPTKRYEAIWKKEGEKIIEKIEETSGLKFKESYINAIVFIAKLPSRSCPLSLKANITNERKLAVLIHELCHRILAANGIGLLKNQFQSEQERTYEVHKVLNLVLYDVWSDLYGEDFAKRNVEAETGWKETQVYKKAWKWALSMSKEKRKEAILRLVRRRELTQKMES